MDFKLIHKNKNLYELYIIFTNGNLSVTHFVSLEIKDNIVTFYTSHGRKINLKDFRSYVEHFLKEVNENKHCRLNFNEDYKHSHLCGFEFNDGLLTYSLDTGDTDITFRTDVLNLFEVFEKFQVQLSSLIAL